MYLWQKGGLYSAVKELLLENEGSNLARCSPSVAGKAHTPKNGALKVTANEEAKSFVSEPIVQVEDRKFKIVNVAGDGNCLFWCFSFYLFGNENSHAVVKKAVVEHAVANWTDEVAMLNSTCEEQTFQNESHYGTLIPRTGPILRSAYSRGYMKST